MASTTATSSIAPVNGIELGYQVFGEGDPPILLHGGFGSMEMFGPNVDALAAGRPVIGVDLQSHGRSPAVDRPMRFETMADDIAAFVPEPHQVAAGPPIRARFGSNRRLPRSFGISAKRDDRRTMVRRSLGVPAAAD